MTEMRSFLITFDDNWDSEFQFDNNCWTCSIKKNVGSVDIDLESTLALTADRYYNNSNKNKNKNSGKQRGGKIDPIYWPIHRRDSAAG